MNYHVSFSPYQVITRKIIHKLTGCIHFSSPENSKGRALVSYVTHPFIISKEELDSTPHTNPFECLEIVETLLDAGYDVDVIDWTNTSFIPKKNYSFFLDVHQNIERLNDKLPKVSKKMFYITGAHWLFQNSAELKRLSELKDRRGTILKPRRNIVPANNIEYADYVVALGNDFARSTYSYARKNIDLLPLPAVTTFPSPSSKDFEKVRKNFVWIGGGGAVHKGLDVVLEAFRELPEYTLTVCGPVQAEKDFAMFYHKELFETKNIKTAGRVNIRTPEFQEIINNALALIYPSCSEGQSGSVITALHAGLIPLISYESGVSVENLGKILTDHSVSYIKDAVQEISNVSIQELKARAEAAWTYAQTHHNREIFRKEFSMILKKYFLI